MYRGYGEPPPSLTVGGVAVPRKHPKVALLGFPTDVHSSFQRGPAQAPALIRAVLRSTHSNNFSERMRDVLGRKILSKEGSVDVELRERDEDREVIQSAVQHQLALHRRVISLGGDHSITYPIIKGHSSRFPNLSIVHVDAHPDMYPGFEGNLYSHACPFARILEDPEIEIERLVQVGIRTMTPCQLEVAERHDVKVFGPGPDQLEMAYHCLPDGPVYVSIDLDGLDPAFAPGVSHPEPGGLSTRDVLHLIDCIPGQVIGADIVEYNPVNDVNGITAQVAAKLVKELLCRITRDNTCTHDSDDE